MNDQDVRNKPHEETLAELKRYPGYARVIVGVDRDTQVPSELLAISAADVIASQVAQDSQETNGVSNNANDPSASQALASQLPPPPADGASCGVYPSLCSTHRFCSTLRLFGVYSCRSSALWIT